MVDSFRLHEQLQVEIEKLVFGGAGLARTSRGVVFIDFVLPQETVQIEITEVKKDYSRGRLLQVTKASPLRRETPCPLLGKCGGCNWQHFSEAEQVAQKQLFLNELFAKHFPALKLQPFQHGRQVWNYRNRIQVIRQNHQSFFHQRKSHDLIPVENCLIADDSINHQLREMKNQSGTAEGRMEVRAQGQPVVGQQSSDFDFSQVNAEMNQRLIETVLQLAEADEWSDFIDLYCGNGNLSFPIAAKFPSRKGLGVELNLQSIQSAREQTQKLAKNTGRLEWLWGSVDSLIPRLRVSPSTLLILDPPRGGCSPNVTSILSRTPAAGIIYVSCNPMTFHRDLQKLTGSGLWKVQSIQGFDMFPQTSHIEAIAHLRIDRQI